MKDLRMWREEEAIMFWRDARVLEEAIIELDRNGNTASRKHDDSNMCLSFINTSDLISPGYQDVLDYEQTLRQFADQIMKEEDDVFVLASEMFSLYVDSKAQRSLGEQVACKEPIIGVQLVGNGSTQHAQIHKQCVKHLEELSEEILRLTDKSPLPERCLSVAEMDKLAFVGIQDPATNHLASEMMHAKHCLEASAVATPSIVSSSTQILGIGNSVSSECNEICGRNATDFGTPSELINEQDEVSESCSTSSDSWQGSIVHRQGRRDLKLHHSTLHDDTETSISSISSSNEEQEPTDFSQMMKTLLSYQQPSSKKKKIRDTKCCQKPMKSKETKINDRATKVVQRRENNKIVSRISRRKRKEYIRCLEERIATLEKQNLLLESELKHFTPRPRPASLSTRNYFNQVGN